MPLVEITIAQGRSPQLVRKLLAQVHEAVRDSLDVPDERIRVLIREIPREHWSAGGITLDERAGSNGLTS